jgi:hypothetical protein
VQVVWKIRNHGVEKCAEPSTGIWTKFPCFFALCKESIHKNVQNQKPSTRIASPYYQIYVVFDILRRNVAVVLENSSELDISEASEGAEQHTHLWRYPVVDVWEPPQ